MKPGDLVVWWTGSKWSRREVFGIVTRVTPKGTVYATYRTGPAEELEFRKRENGNYACRPATGLEKARLEWLDKRPRTHHCTVKFPFGAHDDTLPVGITIFDGVPLDATHEVADELLKIDAWLKEMPGQDTVAPSAEPGH